MKSFNEFFAGVGLVRLALENSGWRCRWANDISDSKMKTYASNFGSADFHLDDIWDLVKDESDGIPHSTLATACFPCTDLSLAGSRKGLAGEQSGTMYAFLKLLEFQLKKGTNPKVILFENVQGFLSSHEGKDVRFTVKALNDLGYVVDIVEINAKLFTPQSRPRVFVLAVERSLADKVMKKIPTNVEKMSILDKFFDGDIFHSRQIRSVYFNNQDLNFGFFSIPTPPPRQTTLQDTIDLTCCDWWTGERKLKLISQISNKNLEIITNLSFHKNFRYLTAFRRIRAGTTVAEIRFDGIAGCLRTPKGGSSKQILLRVGYGSIDIRLLSPREYARLQGVADDFILPENAGKGYFAMGDAVCIPVIEWLDESILTPILSEIE